MKQVLANFVLSYLRFFAKLQLLKNRQARIVGITGSAGKTSCQAAAFAALGANNSHLKIKISQKANSESGIPLNILGLSVKDYSILDWSRLLVLAPIQLLLNWEHFDFYIVEMGIDSPHEPKNMTYLLKIIQPNSAIFLNVRALHSENFDQLVTENDPQQRELEITDLIAQEKGKLIMSLKEKDLAIVNRDDQRVWQISQKSSAEVLNFGQNINSDLRLAAWQVNLTGSSFTFTLGKNYLKKYVKNSNDRDKLQLNFKNLILGKHYVGSLASAILLALQSGLNIKEIETNLEKYWCLDPGRSTLLAGINDSYLLDSSYNASGMLEMIDLSTQLAKNDKKVKRSLAILGDMRELGKESANAHQACARLAAKTFDIVLLVGPMMKKYALPILRTAIENQNETIKQVDIFIDSATAGRNLAKQVQSGDLILLKGSQNTIFIEKATEILLKNPQQNKKLLCRQSNWWLGVKNKN